MSNIIYRQSSKSTTSEVSVLDEPGAGNGCHEYEAVCKEESGSWSSCRVSFQNGPVLESGVNGIQNEQLLAIVIHRLQGFQSGPFKCRSNALALTKLEEAVHWLESRTKEREVRGVEGTNQQ